MRYSYRLSRAAEKGLARVDRRYVGPILRRLDELCDDPFGNPLSIALTGRVGLRRSRVGGYRIIYDIDAKASLLFIRAIAPRGEAYE